MNNPAVKKALGVHASLTFESCSDQVNQAFSSQADGMRNSALLLTDLINEGMRLLVYAGNAGMWLILTFCWGVLIMNQMPCVISWAMSVGFPSSITSSTRSSHPLNPPPGLSRTVGVLLVLLGLLVETDIQLEMLRL